jgi:hypothetical protein
MKLLDDSRIITQRLTRKIIRFRHYGKELDPENYYREQLMLFYPWRDERKELLEINSEAVAAEHWDEILTNSKPFYGDREINDDMLNNLANDLDEDDSEDECDEDDNICSLMDLEKSQYYHEEDVVGSYSSHSKVEKFLIPKIIDDTEYLKIMRTLNEKQRRFVLNTFHLMKTSEVPFHHFLSGGAGVGKSHGITAIIQSCLRFQLKTPSTNPEEVCVLVAAPTGKAAFNVFGMTLHATFRLPPSQHGGKVADLEQGVLSTLRSKIGGVKLFIIDEISMVSVRQLYDIDQRLRQVFATQEDFGGRSLLFVGHLRQLPPVMGSYAFLPPIHLALGSIVGNHLWEHFNLYELTEIMRQRGEAAFCKALNNMSEGCMDAEDIALIKSREITSTNQPPPNAIHLFATNNDCAVHNAKVHAELKTEGAECVAFDKIQGEFNILILYLENIYIFVFYLLCKCSIIIHIRI